MTDQELIQALTEELAPRIRELCADDKMDCDQLCAGNILTAKCIVFQAAERLSALQSENAEKDKEIERLEREKSAAWEYQEQMVDAFAAMDSQALSRVEAERDAAKKCIYDVETYLELGSAPYIMKTIEAWKRGAQGVV